jgi:hypothetical protein
LKMSSNAPISISLALRPPVRGTPYKPLTVRMCGRSTLEWPYWIEAQVVEEPRGLNEARLSVRSGAAFARVGRPLVGFAIESALLVVDDQGDSRKGRPLLVHHAAAKIGCALLG